METIKVNMSPNPLDVQTIHASQNDGEARQWEFELHNNGEVIDAGGITEQMVFKAYEGGTEELLPSGLLNGSVDLGSLDWSYVSAYGGAFQSSGIASVVADNNNPFCAIYTKFTPDSAGVTNTNMGIAINANGNGGSIGGAYGYKNIVITNRNFTDPSAFKQAMQGVYLWYEKSDSTPTTTPFLGDIKYPQGLLTNQQFTYRESPTEEDGLANIVGIKGQTLKWNQHVKNGVNVNYGLTCTIADGTMTVSGTSAVETEARREFRASVTDGLIPVGHKILLLGGSSDYRIRLQGTSTYEEGSGLIYEASSGAEYQILLNMNIAPNTTYNFTIHPQIFDLTQMFGAGNEPSTVEEFTSLFPLYYPYNSGSLIPFMGNGIKTVGKNLLDANIGIPYGGGSGMRWYESQGFMLMANKTYTFSASNTGEASVAVYIIDHATRTALASSSLITTYTPTQNVIVYLQAYRGSGISSETEFQLEFGSSASSYEPYTESVLNLPISTYFPTGMKSAGTVYDELTESKAITRIGSRAYQSGDESNTSVITDGTTTYYALATPTETSFTTASLVTENAEIPLSNEDGVLIGKCTEQLSENPGFFDGKIKLADGDGECYSNKIQLHIERSPQ